MGNEPHGGEPGGQPAAPQQHETEENRIRKRAHEIWVEEGKPEGRALHHWLMAKWELELARNPREEVDRLEQDFAERNKDE